MCCFKFTGLLIFLMHFHISKESGYNCSQFDGFRGEPLVECPPAKFMLKDNLVECFDNDTKSYNPSIRDRVHRNENFVEIIPVFSTFSNFFEKKKINYKSHFM